MATTAFARTFARLLSDRGGLTRSLLAVGLLVLGSWRFWALRQLNDVDHRIPTLGEAAVDTVSRIEKLFARTPIIEISDSVKVRAAQRAIDKRAPFHRQRNGIDDAILIEVYADVVGAKRERDLLLSPITSRISVTRTTSYTTRMSQFAFRGCGRCISSPLG
jgi:hypothetical protein